MRLLTIAVVALSTLVACSDGGSSNAGPFNGENPLAPASSDEIADAVAAFQPGADASHIDHSALDAVTEARRSEFSASATALAAMLPSPDGFGAFRLASLQAEDPNGDGRIGEYWYPPRVLRQECSAKIDAAPHPFAVANYLPGTGMLAGDDPAAAFDLMSSPITVSVMVEPFDEATQLDDYLATTLEFYRDPSFSCGGGQTSVQTFRESALRSDRAETVVFEAEPNLFGGGVLTYTVVDDRLLVAVGVNSDAVEGPWESDDLERWLRPVLEVVLDRLAVAERP